MFSFIYDNTGLLMGAMDNHEHIQKIVIVILQRHYDMETGSIRTDIKIVFKKCLEK